MLHARQLYTQTLAWNYVPFGGLSTQVVSLNGTWKTDSISFTVDPLYRYTVHVRNSSSFGTTTINIDYIQVYGEASASYLTCNEDSVGYRFGFNGQEKDDEIAGVEGAHNTAEFWMYDTRLGRRWNVDPIVRYFESPYATFLNSPINLNDIYGLSPDGGGGDKETGELKATFYFKLDTDLSNNPEADKILNDYIENYKIKVFETWSAQNIGGKKVSLDQVQFLPAPSGMGVNDLGEYDNLITVGYGENHPNQSYASQNTSMVFGRNNSLAYMMYQNAGSDAAHEFGHHFGLSDRYHEGARTNSKHDQVSRFTIPMVLASKIDPEYDPLNNLYSNGNNVLTQMQMGIVFDSKKNEADYPTVFLTATNSGKILYSMVEVRVKAFSVNVFGYNSQNKQIGRENVEYIYSSKKYFGKTANVFRTGYCSSPQHSPDMLNRYYKEITK